MSENTGQSQEADGGSKLTEMIESLQTGRMQSIGQAQLFELLKEAHDEMTSLKSDRQQLAHQIIDLQSDLRFHEEESKAIRDAIEKTNSSLIDQVDDLKAKVEASENVKSHLHETVSTLMADLAIKEDVASKLQSARSDAESEKSKFQTEIKELRGKLKESQDDVSQYKALFKAKLQTAESLKVENDAKVQSLSYNCESLEKRVNDLSALLDNSRDTESQLQSQLEAYEGRHSNLLSEVYTLSSQVQQVEVKKQEIRRLEGELSSAKRSIVLLQSKGHMSEDTEAKLIDPRSMCQLSKSCPAAIETDKRESPRDHIQLEGELNQSRDSLTPLKDCSIINEAKFDADLELMHESEQELDAPLEGKQGEVDALRREVLSMMQARNNELSECLANADECLADAEAENSSLAAKVAAATQIENSMARKVQELEDVLRMRQDEIDRLNEELSFNRDLFAQERQCKDVKQAMIDSRIKMQTDKTEESRMQMEQALKELGRKTKELEAENYSLKEQQDLDRNNWRRLMEAERATEAEKRRLKLKEIQMRLGHKEEKEDMNMKATIHKEEIAIEVPPQLRLNHTTKRNGSRRKQR